MFFRFRRPRQILPSLAAYALWAGSYPPYAHNKLMEIEQAAMLRLLPDLKGKAVLDLACGTGRYSLIARQAGAKTVIGVDNSFAMLQKGSELKPGTEVGLFAQASMIDLPFPADSFDVILCGLATGHLPPEIMGAAFKAMARITRGAILFSDFHPFLYLNGGQRTFTGSDGKTYAVEHYPHLVSDYFAAIRAAGLTLTAVEEPLTTLKKATLPAVLVMSCQKR